MPRPSSGQVVEKLTQRGPVFALRFRAYGKRRYLTLPEGTTRAGAERDLGFILADVARGRWEPPPDAVAPHEPAAPLTFHEFASEWLQSRAPELRPSTVQAYRNELTGHLLPFFAKHELREITVVEVDRYREHVLREGERRRDAIAAGKPLTVRIGGRAGCRPYRRVLQPMSRSYLNATITRLGAILDVADERGLIDRNPVRVNPRNRKVKVNRSKRAYLDRPAQIRALLQASSALDADAGNRADRDTCLRRPLVATLIFAGLRISEALALKWRDVDLANGRVRVGDAKTDAGVRWVPLAPSLREDLLARKMNTRFADVDDLVFTTIAGGKVSRDNARSRILIPARKLADELLLAADLAPLPERLTLHSLRHTYISLRVAIGDDLASISQDAGHADITVTFRIYTHVMALRDGEREELRELVQSSVWAPLGTSATAEAVTG
jgi:integrase